jgi:3-phenylpropionate/trans-cinnamate dioxygenase ferredoxin reductase component
MSSSLDPLTRPDQTLVVIGAGLAGLRTAEGAREAGFPGRIVLVGDESHPPYDRPPLSKAVLMTEGHEHEIALSPPDALEALKLDLRLGRAAVAIDRAARQVRLSDGEVVGYDRLVLATGSTMRTLEQLPPDRPGVCYLRGLDDALALRAALGRARRVAVIGAGVIGLEVAASAVAPQRSVTVIEAASRVMGRAASPAISAFVADRHRAAGVDLRLGVTVTAVAQAREAITLGLSDGASLEADLVVVGVGVSPNDRLARECGLEVQPGGIVVDAHGATSDPAIYAAGEVALHFNTLHGRHDRQETWAHASAHGEHVGRSLLKPEGGYCEVCSYWSDQYDFNLNVVGAPIGDEDVVRGDPASGRFLVFHLVEGRVAGVSAVGDTRGLRAARKLIGLAVEPSRLADAGEDLRALAGDRAA